MVSNIFISLLHQEGSKTQFFRPNQPTFMILPQISMIMYDLYWSKYFLFLRKNGLDYQRNQPISELLYSTKNFGLDYRNIPGIIAQCAIIKEQGGEVDTFNRYLSGNPASWLFQDKEWTQPMLEVVNTTMSKDYQKASDIFRGIIGNSFKKILKDEYVDIKEFLIDISEQVDDKLQFVTILSNEIGEKMIYKYHKGYPLGPNFIFTRDIVCDGNIDIKTSYHQALANNIYHLDGFEGLSLLEQKAFLNILARTNQGKIVLSSMFIDKFLSEFQGTYHDFFNCYLYIEENLDIILKDIDNNIDYKIDNQIIIDTAFAWELNVFLYSGEFIIRKLFYQQRETYNIQKASINSFLQRKINSDYINDCTKFFNLFINNLMANKSMLQQLRTYIIKYQSHRRKYFINFLSKLKKLVERKKTTLEIFLELACLNENVMYDGAILSFQNFEYSDPVFTGYGAFKRWREGILRS